jgi:hypothetical protein
VGSGKKRKRNPSSTITHWGTSTREAKAAMSDDELCCYFQRSLADLDACGLNKCTCLDVLKNSQCCALIAKYLVWFERKRKEDQDGLLVDWYKYASSAGGGKTHMYVLPYKIDSIAETIDDESMGILRQSKVCTRGLMKVMHFGRHRFQSVRNASKTTGVMPAHGNTGKTPSNAVTGDDERGKALNEHFDYLMQLGEVRATRVIATMVDGAQGHTNRGETTVDVGNNTAVVYLRLMNIEQLRTHTSTNLTNVLCSGLNPYKMVELWKNYRPHIPIPLRKNILYAKPDAKVMSMVKEERSDRSVFRAKLKEAKAAGMRSRLESLHFLMMMVTT